MIRALRQPGTVTGALAGDAASRPLWQRVAQQSAKPVVLVPAGARDQPPRIRRVLLPLDGTARSAAAVAATAERLARGGAELVVLHVFDAETVPKFWDQQPTPARPGSRSSSPATARSPAPGWNCAAAPRPSTWLKVAGAEQADMIALAWSQRLDPGRAPIVRRAILEAAVPVMLVPMPPDDGTSGPAASATPDGLAGCVNRSDCLG